MIGAIIGDYCGSTYEFDNIRPHIKIEDIDLLPEGSHITDDGIMTCAVADALMNGKDIATNLKDFYKMYPDSKYSYGSSFEQWCRSKNREAYNSWGGGSAMRVSSVGWLYNTYQEVIDVATKTAEVTHNHPEGIKGAVATALCIYMARNNYSKDAIKKQIQKDFPSYNLDRTLEDIRPDYYFDESCQGIVPESIICFLESTDYLSCLRNCIFLGGDTDTICCISGSISSAFYGTESIPKYISNHVLNTLPDHLKAVIDQFNGKT